MELIGYIEILWQRRWVIFVTVLVAIAVVLAGTSLMSPVYAASAKLRILTSSTGFDAGDRYDINYADRLMRTYAEIAVSRPVLEEVAARLSLVDVPRVDVEIVSVTELMSVTGEGVSAAQAVDVANTLAQILVERGRELYTGSAPTVATILEQRLEETRLSLERIRSEYERLLREAPEDHQLLQTVGQTIEIEEQLYANLLSRYESGRTADIVRSNAISIIEPAVPPEAPARPNRALNLMLGTAGGLVVGSALALVSHSFGPRLTRSDDIRDIVQAPVLATIARIPRRKRSGLLPSNCWESETIRQLRTNLLVRSEVLVDRAGAAGLPERKMQSLLFTSAVPREGKSLLVANLACSIAQLGLKVLVIDADMRRPSQHRHFKVANTVGLSDLLCQGVHDRSTIDLRRSCAVDVLTSGKIPHDPTALFSSGQFKVWLSYFAQSYDLILVDSPALLAVADASVLAQMVDQVVLVTRRGVITRQLLSNACDQLRYVKAPLLGVVVNAAAGIRYPRYYANRGQRKTVHSEALPVHTSRQLSSERGGYVASRSGILSDRN